MTVWRPLTQALSAPDPLPVRETRGATLILEDGREIFDGISGWWFTTIGHANARVAEAIYRQALTCEHLNFADFTHAPGEALAQRLLAKLPHTHLFYSDNGSTAIEVALKMALQYWHNRGETSRTTFVRFEGGYHGDTFGAMAMGFDSPYYRPFLSHLMPVETLPYPTTPDLEADALEQLAHLLSAHPHQYAGILIEPLIQGAAGMRICRPQFLVELERIATTLVIYDEVMTGFGRTGEWFACHKAGTSPDLIALAKGLSGGYLPLAATCATEEIYSTFLSSDPYQSFSHAHTFGGSALGCAAGLEALNILEEEESFRQFEVWHRELMPSHPAMRNIRICGTVAAFDIETDEPDGYYNPIGPRLKGALLERGYYFRPLGNTFYLMPPYCTSRHQLAGAYAAIEEVLESLSVPKA